MFTKSHLVEFVWCSLSVAAMGNPRFGPEAFDGFGILLKTGDLRVGYDQLV
jgi:hypothetical protein